MTKKETQKQEAIERKALREHKKNRGKITNSIVKKDENAVDHFNIPDVITTDIGGKLLFGSIFAGYKQDSHNWRYCNNKGV